MESSEEIGLAISRWITSTLGQDADAAVGPLSDHPGALQIGTDEAEWWRGREAVALFRRQFQERTSSISHRVDEIEAWEEGTTGWGAARLTVEAAGKTFGLRASFVVHLEHGQWKVVQAHLSAPLSNEVLFGQDLTVTIEELRASVERERPDLSGNLADDGTVTIVFTDIVDSTVVLARIGDEAWLDVLRRYDALIEEATAAYGGTVVEIQGDGSMLAFSSARRAVACAQAIQSKVADAFADHSPPILVRIGAHTGDALHEGNRFYGTTVHYAARVASQALGGEVLVSRLVHDLVMGHQINFVESREVPLKGLDGSHRLYAVDVN
jgi:adenylate cyclase